MGLYHIFPLIANLTLGEILKNCRKKTAEGGLFLQFLNGLEAIQNSWGPADPVRGRRTGLPGHPTTRRNPANELGITNCLDYTREFPVCQQEISPVGKNKTGQFFRRAYSVVNTVPPPV